MSGDQHRRSLLRALYACQGLQLLSLSHRWFVDGTACHVPRAVAMDLGVLMGDLGVTQCHTFWDQLLGADSPLRRLAVTLTGRLGPARSVGTPNTSPRPEPTTTCLPQRLPTGACRLEVLSVHLVTPCDGRWTWGDAGSLQPLASHVDRLILYDDGGRLPTRQWRQVLCLLRGGAATEVAGVIELWNVGSCLLELMGCAPRPLRDRLWVCVPGQTPRPLLLRDGVCCPCPHCHGRKSINCQGEAGEAA